MADEEVDIGKEREPERLPEVIDSFDVRDMWVRLDLIDGEQSSVRVTARVSSRSSSHH